MENQAGKSGANWIDEEFSDINFGDERLLTRFLKIGKSLSSKHESPINQACEDWSDTKAAYRFFANQKSRAEKILSSHQKRTKERMQGHDYLLSLHDTTYLNYSKHKSKQGLGKISKINETDLNGLVVHGSLIITLEGLPLGRLTQKIWARTYEGNKKQRNYQQQSIEEKESYKWIEGLREVMRHCPEDVNLIHICDRESDIYEFFLEAEKLETYILIRANHNRELLDEDEARLWDFMEEFPKKNKLKIEVPAKNSQPARVVDVEIKFSEIEIKCPRRRDGNSHRLEKSILLTAIWLKEPHPPAGIEGIEWMLLTNLPVSNVQDTLTCIKWYQQRWSIETYHKIWKSGCRVEDCRLETADRLIRYLTLMSIIAWRIFWMTHINRTNGDLPCTIILAEHEWKCLYCKINKTNILPDKIPTVQQAIIWIARLGGFLARRSDGNPGATTIWRGWQRLTDFSESWLCIQSLQLVGNS